MNILDYIPQKPPFVMVDSLIFCDKSGAKTSFKLLESNVFWQKSDFSEAVLIENMAQSIAAWSALSTIESAETLNFKPKIGFIGSVKNFSVYEMPVLGTCIETEIQLLHDLENIKVVKGTIFQQEKLLAEGELHVFIQEES